MPGTRGTYRRVLLKLSGEVFGGEKGIGVDPDVVQDIAKQIADVARSGVQVAIVVVRNASSESDCAFCR